MSRAPKTDAVGPSRTGRNWLIGIGSLVLVLCLVVFTAPIWLRPFVEAWASAALGRTVTIGHLAVSLGRLPQISATKITVATSAEVTDVPYLAAVDELTLTLDLRPLLHLNLPAIPDISIAGMEINAVEPRPGVNNWALKAPSSGKSAQPAAIPPIGVVHIKDSHAHVVMAPVAADVRIAIRTEGEPDGTIVANVTGTYAGQPITGRMTGGALLSLRDAANPYPVDIQLANGASHISLTGSVRDPLHLAGADLKLELSGQNLADLYPLTGIPIPPTPPFHVTGSLDYAEGNVQFTRIAGRLGSTDLAGDLRVDTKPTRPVVLGELRSRRVDMQDLAGFIGSQPGRLNTPGLTPAQRQAVAQAIANPRLIPNLPMDIPKIRAADFHLTYRGDGFVGGSVPFDNLATRLDIDDGHIRLTGLRFGIGRGQIAGEIDMMPVEDNVHTKATLDFQRLDVARLLSALKFVRGDGVLGGRAQIDAMGKSLSEILINGNGSLSVFMAGGNVSALVIDLSGLQLADATLAALGLPNRQQVQCLIGDMTLAQGSLQTRTLILDTTENRTYGQVTIDMRTEQLSAHLRTDAKHFTVGSLPTQINVSGTLKNPTFAPDPLELGARGGAAVGLGMLFPLAALLPTIQLGIGEDNACTALARGGNSPQQAPKQPPPKAPSRRAPR